MPAGVHDGGAVLQNDSTPQKVQVSRQPTSHGSPVQLEPECLQLSTVSVPLALRSYASESLADLPAGHPALDGWWVCTINDGPDGEHEAPVYWVLQLTVGLSQSVSLGSLVHAAREIRDQVGSDADVRLALVVPTVLAQAHAQHHQRVEAGKRPAAPGSWYHPKTDEWKAQRPEGVNNAFQLEEAEAEAAMIPQQLWAWTPK